MKKAGGFNPRKSWLNNVSRPEGTEGDSKQMDLLGLIFLEGNGYYQLQNSFSPFGTYLGGEVSPRGLKPPAHIPWSLRDRFQETEKILYEK